MLQVAHGLAGALEHMHYCGICHGDVYAHNVLVDEKADSVILCDYGEPGVAPAARKKSRPAGPARLAASRPGRPAAPGLF